MNKLSYYKMMGLRKRAARISLSQPLRTLSKTLFNYSNLRRMSVRKAEPQALMQVLKGIPQQLVNMAPFKFALLKNPDAAQKIARQAHKQAWISLSDYHPRQIKSLKNPSEILGHIINYQGAPTILLGKTRMSPDSSFMSSNNLLSTLHSVLQNTWGRGFRMPTNKSNVVSHYFVYPELPGTKMSGWKDNVLRQQRGHNIDYIRGNRAAGRVIRLSNHINTNGVGEFTNIVAKDKGIPLFDLQQSLDQMRRVGLIPREVNTVLPQNLQQVNSKVRKLLTDEFGQLKGDQKYLQLLDNIQKGLKRVPQITLS